MRLFFKNEAKSLSSEFYPNQVWGFFKQALNERKFSGNFYCFCLGCMNETSHNRTIAPITDVIKLPIEPTGIRPKSPNNQPPSKPPIMPTTKLTTNPKPPPLITFPAKYPAAIPIIINQRKFITSKFICKTFRFLSFYLNSHNKFIKTGKFYKVKPI